MIEADGIGRSFKVRGAVVHAVQDLSFEVRRGEFVGCLGPNGAGKSTTIKMLTGILAPSSGNIRVAGLDPTRKRKALARRIGVVFGQRTTLWWDLPLKDSFDLVRLLYKVDRARFRERLDEMCALLDLGPFLKTPVRQLSLGQRMRGDIAAALLHDPTVLVLDEPTIGLDVVSKAGVRDFLRRLNAERGTTVLLTTHDLGDIEKLCRRVMLIDHGRLAFDGTVDDLRAMVPGETSIEDVVAHLYVSSTPCPGSLRTPPPLPVDAPPSGTASAPG